ncbi:alpha/beta hydrolase [Azoarcus sp. KH32C]|uniref:alpha/beta hydrolase n=1 Tax=Azoarcus sp. KH32C TaxID=748247 RepID=UPI0002386461|nr:alpha/beta fold hydrolase [Azoarcus sp. KH32C]BAL22519.1 acyl-CoA thioester hydrolase [Azoarcus sp. KH32C]
MSMAITFANALMLFTGAAATLAVLRAAAHYAIRVTLAAPCVRETETPAARGLAFETVRIPTANGRQLHAWLIPRAATGRAPGVVLVHGWGGNAQAMLPLAGPLHRAGFTTLLIDARCHGLSDADTFASLPRFAEDASHACDWLAARTDIDAQRIALLGHSVGAGAVLLAAARRADIAAVVSVSAFAHPEEMMRRVLAAKRIPDVLARYILRHVERTIGHRFDDIAPLASIARLRCPVLLVHGEQDIIVPPADARRLHAAARPGAVDLLILSGDHESFTDMERELAAVVVFLQRAFWPCGISWPPERRN